MEEVVRSAEEVVRLVRGLLGRIYAEADVEVIDEPAGALVGTVAFVSGSVECELEPK